MSSHYETKWTPSNTTLFTNKNLIGEMYLEMMENANNPIMTDTDECQLERDGNSLYVEVGVHFQQDRSPPHYSS